MAATVGKYVLKASDEAADWIKDLKFGLSKADKDHDIVVLDVDVLESVFNRSGLDYVAPGAITTPGFRNNSVGTRYADFVEFAEKNQDTPIHMPVARFDGSGTFYGFDNGRHRFAALRDAGLKQIPVAVRKSESSRIPVYLNPKPLEKTDVPITGNTQFKPTELNSAQKKELDALSEAGYPQHTAKSIVLGDLPMDTASRVQRQQAQNLTATGYHGSGQNDIINLDQSQNFWMGESPVVANTYLPPNVLEEPGTVYKLAYNPDKYATTNASGEFWSNLDQTPMTIREPGQNIPSTVKGLSKKYLGTGVTDTDDLANLVDNMGLPGIEISDIRDVGSNFKQARNLFTDEQGNLDNKAWSQFLNEYDTFGGKNIVAVGDKTGIRSATGAAFDPRNRALPNIMGGSAALAIGLGANESEAGIPDAAAKAVNKAINVRVDKKAGIDYADEILSGNKTFETRNTDSLRPYVGQRVGIARTGAGEAKALGSAEIGEPIVVDEATFRAMQDQHLVPPGTDFDIAPGGTKYLYPVSNPERFDTPKDVGKGIVARKILGGGAATAFGLGASDSSQAAVERLNAIMEGRMSPTNRSRSAQAQKTITGEFPVTPTQEVVYRTMSENFDPNPDVGSITGVPMNPVSQAAGNVGFALQGFGDRAADAGPLGWMVGTAIKDLGEISQRAAYGESKATDPAMAVLDILALTPGAYMSQGMRTAMSDKDVGSMIFRELLK